MVNPVFCIRDRKGSFWSPRIEQNEGSARRSFAMLVNDSSPSNPVSFAPHDFELYRIGDFDNDTGNFVSMEKKEFICSGDMMVGIGYEK